MRLPAALVCALLCAGILAPSVAADPPVDDCGPTELGCGTDLQWANDLEDAIADNIWDGQVYEILYDDVDNEGNPLPRKRQHVADVHAYGDSALWTGTYLGAQSMRYALAKHKLSQPGLPGPQAAEWEKHKDEAKARIDDMVRKFHVLVNISQHWNHELNVSHEQAGFGGGVFNGEPGYLMRACIDENAPEWQRWDDEELARPEEGPESEEPYTGKPRVFGPFPWENEDGSITNYLCEDGTSRDAYAGTIFGLLLAFDLVSGDDAAMRTQIRDDIVTLSNFAFKYLWNTPRPHGRIRLPLDEAGFPSCDQINSVIKTCGHDFENFISPLFVYTPWAQMEMTQAAHHVTTKHPGHADTQKWQTVFAAELAAMTPFLAFSHLFDTADPYGSYYKWNLEHLISFNLVRQAPNDLARTVYKQGIGVMDATTGDDINAHFEAITYGLTGEQGRLDASLEHLRQWRDYRNEISDGVPYDNRPDCANGTITCVPKDRRDMEATPGAPRITVFPGVDANLRALDPLPVARRQPTDFLWQREPNKLHENNPPSAHHQAPGIDYLLPYWMLRFLTEGASAPIEGSFPVWPGPSFH